MSSYSAIPAELRALDQWLVWRYEVRGGRRTKVPYDAKHPQRRAASTKPATWSSFETTVEAAQGSDIDGIGFAVEGTEYVALDLVTVSQLVRIGVRQVLAAKSEAAPPAGGSGLEVRVQGATREPR
jgi:putative DNA primase/helicase